MSAKRPSGNYALLSIALSLCLVILTGCSDSETPVQPSSDAGTSKDAGTCSSVDCGDDETCYRGLCYPACDTTTDCDDDAHCFGDRCAPLDCQGVDCGEGESCYRGVCYPDCEYDGDCDGDNHCYDDRCAPTTCDEMVCFDDEICYLGVCYPSCTSDDDCSAEEMSCVDGACVELSCEPACEFPYTCEGGECVCDQECCGDDDCAGDGFCSDNQCLTPPFIYLGARDGVKKVDSEGRKVWRFEPEEESVSALAVHPEGYLYAGTFEHSIYRVDAQEGAKLWSDTDHNGGVRAIAVDPEGNAITGGSDGLVRKLDSQGQELWHLDTDTSAVFDVTVDAEGDIYCAVGESVWKLDPQGQKLATIGEFGSRVTLDEDGNLYVSQWGDFSDENTIHAYSPDGDLLWGSESHGGYIQAIDTGVDEKGEVSLYVVTYGIFSYSEVSMMYRYDREGQRKIEREFGATALDVSASPEGYFYVGTGSGEDLPPGTSGVVQKYSPDGDQIWEFDEPETLVHAVAVEPGEMATFPSYWGGE